MAIIFLAVCFILILVNVITAFLVDWEAAGKDKQEAAMVRIEWWRDERSSYGWVRLSLQLILSKKLLTFGQLGLI